VRTRCWENGAGRLARRTVATKNAITAKRNKARYACTRKFCLRTFSVIAWDSLDSTLDQSFSTHGTRNKALKLSKNTINFVR
jgi:hypothetical protein